ncbi:MAG: hypothetical protein A3J38_10365 [Gammaproteobacteria bacterium RIFCSPHIGHO2_12_FULL_45_9]|nr:MAG: hypothetical protein A3J38_10365 [Gammaproteobacteria bacterium RIFCSPHIGHO2_12_FULL_45_9]
MIPIQHVVAGRSFQTLVVVIEHFERSEIGHARGDIVRLHYLYSIEPVEGLYAKHHVKVTELFDPATTSYVAHNTCFLHTHAERHNFRAWRRRYRHFSSSSHQTNQEMWYSLHGRFEDYYTQHNFISDPNFRPIDFTTEPSQWQFVPSQQATSSPTQTRQLSTTSSSSQSSTEALMPLEISDTITAAPVNSTDVSEMLLFPRTMLNTAGQGMNLGRYVVWGIQGDNATSVAVNTPVGGVATAILGVGLLCECVELFNRFKDKRFDEPATWIATVNTGTHITSSILWPVAFVGNKLSLFPIMGGVDAASAGIAVITDLYSLYTTHRSKKTMAECLVRLEAYCRDNMAELFQERTAITAQQAVETGTYQHLAGFLSLYVMITWLTRKYRRYSVGTTVSLAHGTVQLGIAIGVAVALAASATATFGVVGAIGFALGLFYLGASMGRGIQGNRNNAAILKAYKASVEDLHARRQISEEEYTQEKLFFDLADKLHPIRHHLFSTTMGDYMRVKIAHFVLTTKQAAETRNAFWDLSQPHMQILKLCADLMGDAIGYQAKRHGQCGTTIQLHQNILRLGRDIPIRGY